VVLTSRRFGAALSTYVRMAPLAAAAPREDATPPATPNARPRTPISIAQEDPSVDRLSLRALKGAPLSCFVALSIVEHAGVTGLAEVSAYQCGTVIRALCKLRAQRAGAPEKRARALLAELRAAPGRPRCRVTIRRSGLHWLERRVLTAKSPTRIA